MFNERLINAAILVVTDRPAIRSRAACHCIKKVWLGRAGVSGRNDQPGCSVPMQDERLVLRGKSAAGGIVAHDPTLRCRWTSHSVQRAQLSIVSRQRYDRPGGAVPLL